MARISVDSAQSVGIRLSEFQAAELGVTGNVNWGVKILMIPAKYIRDASGKVLRGCVLVTPHNDNYIERELIVIDRESKRIIPRHPKLRDCEKSVISGYPRVPAITWQSGTRDYDHATCQYIPTLADIDEIHKHSPLLIGADINRIMPTINNIEEILRAIMTIGKVSDRAYGIRGDPHARVTRTAAEISAFHVHANRHLKAFSGIVGAHSGPYQSAIERASSPTSIDQFNTELRQTVSPELFDDLVRTGCVISGSYVLRALTTGQSDFKANDIDIYCTDRMFASCLSLHRCARSTIISRDKPHMYCEPRIDIADIIAIKSYIYVRDIPAAGIARYDAIDVARRSAMKIQFIILQDGVDNVTKWIRDTFDISFLTSVWREGKFDITDEKELIARTGIILPSYMDGLDMMPPQRIWLTMLRIVKYVQRGFRIENTNKFAERVMDWFQQVTSEKIIELSKRRAPARIE